MKIIEEISTKTYTRTLHKVLGNIQKTIVKIISGLPFFTHFLKNNFQSFLILRNRQKWHELTTESVSYTHLDVYKRQMCMELSVVK